ncbi:MAG: TrkA family potassium uptake protein [Cytophagales bacterium]|nr:TrkA family potassium uptake protein [Bernardetiaceae bacterium]MDW8209526.1 TrkA family potassium uptake protein [Cytophagales bacterium]
MSSGHRFAVIGLGQFGFSVARNLAARGAEVLAIDKDIDLVEEIRDEVAYAVALDATDFKALSSQSIADMDAVLVAIGENTEGLLLTVVQLLELKAKRIIARAMSQQQKLILQKLGITEIISPEEEIGMMVAEMLLNPNMKAIMPLPDNYEIVEIQVPRKAYKRSLKDIGLADNYRLELIAIKRKYEEYFDARKRSMEHLIIRPSEDTELEYSDVIIVLGKSQDVVKFIEFNK